MRRLWAAFERLIPRAVLAIATVVAAAVTDPHAIGIYSWGVLALTLHQAITDQSIRHLAVGHIDSVAGREFLRTYTRLASYSGAVFMLAAVVGIASFASDGEFRETASALSPLVLTPIAQALSVSPTAALQHFGSWRTISVCRTVASLMGIAIGIPAVLLTKSIVGACIAIAGSEILYALLVSYAARAQRAVTGADDATEVLGKWSTYRHMAIYSLLAWLQGQSERVLLGAWASTSALGSYSVGSSVGRSAGDSIAASQANVLRVDIARLQNASDTQIRQVLARNMRAGLLLSSLSAAGTVLLAMVVLDRILGEAWAAALEMVPILALTAIPSSISWSSAPVHIQRGRARTALLAPALALCFAPAVAIAATQSLPLAAWMVLGRDCLLALMQFILMGAAAPRREGTIAAATLSAGAAIIAIVMYA